MKNLLRSVYTLFVLLLMSGYSNFVTAQSLKKETNLKATPYKLVVQIVVPGLDWNLIQQYGHNLSKGGILRLFEGGGTYARGEFDNFIPSSPSYLATISAGTHASINGIVGTLWLEQFNKEKVNLTIDKSTLPVAMTDRPNFSHSPHNFFGTSFSDELKKIYSKSKIYSLALDPASAVVMGGKKPTLATWYNRKTGFFETSSYYVPVIPDCLVFFNVNRYSDTYLSMGWSCFIDNSKYISTKKKDISTVNRNYKMPPVKANSDKDRYHNITVNGYGNSILKDLAISIISEEALGKDGSPDVLSIVFDAQRHVLNTYGGNSMEFEDCLYRLDKDIAEFLAFLDNNTDPSKNLIVLTSDLPVNTFEDKKKYPVFDEVKYKMLLGSYLDVLYGDKDWLIDYKNRQVYLNTNEIRNNDISQRDISLKAAIFTEQFEGVNRAIPTIEMYSARFPDVMYRKAANSYNAKRSGDIFVQLSPTWREKIGGASSSYEIGSQYPIVFYNPNVKPFVSKEEVLVNSIAVTLCDIFSIKPPVGALGKILFPR